MNKRKLLFPLLSIALLAGPIQAQEPDADAAKGLIATIEIRGINNVMRQASSAMQMVGQEMEVEDMQALFGAMVMSQEGIDLDKTLRIFIPDTEFNMGAMAEPPVVIAFPTKGDAFLESLALSMNKKAGDKPDESHFSPKPGGAAQLGGMPSLSSMPFHTKKVGGDTVLLGPNLKFVRSVIPHMAKLADRKNVPGTIAVDLDVSKLVKAAEKGVKEMQAQQKAMMGGFIKQQEDMIKQLKKDGAETAELQQNLDMMKKQADGGTMKQGSEAVFELLRQVDVLQFGLEAKNKMFTMYTLAEPKTGTTLGKSIADMKAPSEAFRRAVPEDAVMAYVGRIANMEDMMTGYMGWMDQMLALVTLDDPDAGKEMAPLRKMMKEASELWKGQLQGDMMSVVMPGMKQLGAVAVNDADKMEAGIHKLYNDMGKLEFGEAGIDKMEWKQGEKRTYKGKAVTSYKLDLEMDDEIPQFGAPNPLQMMGDTAIDIGNDGKNLVFANGSEAYNNLVDSLSGKGAAEPFEARGTFAKNFPRLPTTPTSMYSYDLLAYMNSMVEAMGLGGKDFPKRGATLTGWSNKLGDKYLHVDRIRFEDVTKAVQAGQQLFEKQMQQMQEGFGAPDLELNEF